jgi:hypothetical protein
MPKSDLPTKLKKTQTKLSEKLVVTTKKLTTPTFLEKIKT